MGRNISPLTVGYRVQEHGDSVSSPQGHFSQDGYISAILLSLYSLACGAALSLSYRASQLHHQVSKPVVQMYLVTLMAGALAVMTLLEVTRWGHQFYWQVKTGTPLDLHLNLERNAPLQSKLRDLTRNIKRVVREALPVLGIIIFNLLSFCQNAMRIFSHSSCFWAFYTHGKMARYAISVLYHIVQILFMAAETAFCVLFYNRAMVRRTFVRYGLLLVVTASLAIWFDNTVYDATLYDRELRHQSDNSSNDSRVPDCLREDTALYRTTDLLTRYLYPVTTQYLLLASEVILTLFFNAGCRLECSGGVTMEMSKTTKRIEASGQQETHKGTAENTTMKLQCNTRDDKIAGNKLKTGLTRKQRNILRISKYMTRVIIVSVNFILLVLLCISEDFSPRQSRALTLHTVYQVMLMAVLLAGIFLSRRFHLDRIQYKGLEKMVVVSTMGIFCYNCLTLLAVFGYHDDHIPSFLKSSDVTSYVTGMCVLKLLGMVNCFLQSNFMVVAVRINRKKMRHMQTRPLNMWELSDRTQHAREFPKDVRMYSTLQRKLYGTVFKHILFHVGIYNLVLWLLDVLLMAHMEATDHAALFFVQEQFYGETVWAGVVHIIKPISLFYGFNTAIIFLMAFLKKN